jgi:hypothetical protein
MPDENVPIEVSRARDKDELRAFVYELRDLLRAIVEDSRLIPEDHGEDVRRAWESIQGRFTELIARLDELNPEEQLGVPTSQWAPLDQHGLTGDELRLKRRGFVGRMFAWGHRINRPWVRSVLRWANTLLGSLADVFPPAAPIKEFKESLENLIEDSIADDRQSKRRRRKKLRGTSASGDN